jgi:hypothetical protein
VGAKGHLAAELFRGSYETGVAKAGVERFSLNYTSRLISLFIVHYCTNRISVRRNDDKQMQYGRAYKKMNGCEV